MVTIEIFFAYTLACILNHPGSWLLAPGSWLLAPGSWLLARIIF